MASTPEPPVLGEDAAGATGSGDYEVGPILREGWGGTIREGRYRPTGRRVTVEKVRPGLVSTAGLVERLAELGREMAALREPHLLAVYDLVNDGAAYRLIAEWSEASSLTTSLRRRPLPPRRAVAVLCDVLTGLEALHARGLFHGQVGPETVVVEADGQAKLAELALCAAAAPPGCDAHTDVRDAARLGLHLLRAAGPRLRPVRAPLEAAVTEPTTAAELRVAVESAAVAALGTGWREVEAPQTRRPRVAGRRRPKFALAALLAIVAAALVAAVLLLALRGGTARSTGPLSVGAGITLTVNPQSAGCNTTFAFVGRGPLSGTGTLVYRWEQSDGQVTADTSLPIDGSEGSFELNQAWRLEGSQTVKGTMTLHILKPVDRSVSRTFQYTCP